MPNLVKKTKEEYRRLWASLRPEDRWCLTVPTADNGVSAALLEKGTGEWWYYEHGA